MKTILTAALLAVALPAGAAELRFATTSDPTTLDPNAGNSAPVFSLLINVYEGLVRRDRDMKLEPSLATAWEPIGAGEGWRFTLREGVTFHGGQDFTAEDVIFSYERGSAPESDTSSWYAGVERVEAVDDYTVEFYTTEPNPIFPDSIANWMMLDKGWAEENDAALPSIEQGNFATLNTNGTGPYMVTERQPGLKTTLVAFDGWWDDDIGNVTEAVYQPVQNSATAVAALLSGELDLIEPVPIQDAARIEQSDGVDVIRGIEARVIMLGFPHDAESLIAGGEGNPFKDVRVRQAVAHAINIPAILQTVMRGSAEQATQLIGPGLRGYSENIAPGTYDPDLARQLLAEAGYPDGFAFSLKCTNDRYLNDEAVCTAINAMLAQVGLKPLYESMPVANYWTTLRAEDHDMYLLGWSPGTFDAEHPLRFLVATPNEETKMGSWNFGGFSNARIDELMPMIQSEIDEPKRQAMLDEANRIMADEQAYVPLYIQPLVWGVKEGVEVVQRPDNFLVLRWMNVPE